MTRFDPWTLSMLGVCSTNSANEFCWQLWLCLATWSVPVPIFSQLPEVLRLNWDITSNFMISNPYLAEAALYFFSFPLEYVHKSYGSYGNKWLEIICRFAYHKNAAGIENINPKMLENLWYIIIALFYLKNMSFNRRKTQKVRNRQIRICSAGEIYELAVKKKSQSTPTTPVSHHHLLEHERFSASS